MILELRNIEKSFGDKKVLTGVSFKAEGGKAFGLLGNKDDYKLDIEKGIGSISVDGDNISNDREIGNGINEVEIHGGVGAINVKFKES